MHVNKTKFERSGSLEYYQVICIVRTKHRALEVYYRRV